MNLAMLQTMVILPTLYVVQKMKSRTNCVIPNWMNALAEGN